MVLGRVFRGNNKNYKKPIRSQCNLIKHKWNSKLFRGVVAKCLRIQPRKLIEHNRGFCAQTLIVENDSELLCKIVSVTTTTPPKALNNLQFVFGYIVVIRFLIDALTSKNLPIKECKTLNIPLKASRTCPKHIAKHHPHVSPTPPQTCKNIPDK